MPHPLMAVATIYGNNKSIDHAKVHKINPYITRAKNMLSKASSLMDIYSETDAEKIQSFFATSTTETGKYKKT